MTGPRTNDDLLPYPCGSCGAAPGEPCRSGTTGLPTSAHTARWDMWRLDPKRAGEGGRASAGQYAAGRRWADRWARWAALTDADRVADFEAAETADENERWRRS